MIQTFHLPKKGTFENLYREIDGIGIWRKKGLLYPNGHFDTMISEDIEIQDTLPEEFFMIYN